MPEVDWYVVQVEPGQERRMCQLIQVRCDEHDELADDAADLVKLDECFAPRIMTQRRRKTGYADTMHALLPGYVIAAVDDPAKLGGVLRQIPDFCRLVTAGETFVPLNRYERTWLEAYTAKGERVVPMSFGYRADDGQLKVVEGPLKGQEAHITKVNRSASLAHLEFHVGQFKIKTTVGLGIMPKGVLDG